jgi:chromosome segregation ATPase
MEFEDDWHVHIVPEELQLLSLQQDNAELQRQVKQLTLKAGEAAAQQKSSVEKIEELERQLKQLTLELANVKAEAKKYVAKASAELDGTQAAAKKDADKAAAITAQLRRQLFQLRKELHDKDKAAKPSWFQANRVEKQEWLKPSEDLEVGRRCSSNRVELMDVS